jgi:hypothetical protein
MFSSFFLIFERAFSFFYFGIFFQSLPPKVFILMGMCPSCLQDRCMCKGVGERERERKKEGVLSPN